MQRIGLLDRPLAELSAARKASHVVEALGAKLVGALVRLVTWPLRVVGLVGKKRRLTETYLQDPTLRAASGDARWP
jgi:hypothetical protein